MQVLILLLILLPAFFLDLKFRRIPDKLIVVGFFLFLPFLFYSTDSFVAGALGLFAGGGLLYLVAVISKGGVGGGDIKLSSLIGLYLGWKCVVLALFIAFFLAGLIVGALLLSKKKNEKEKISFGPFLAIGAVCTVCIFSNPF